MASNQLLSGLNEQLAQIEAKRDAAVAAEQSLEGMRLTLGNQRHVQDRTAGELEGREKKVAAAEASIAQRQAALDAQEADLAKRSRAMQERESDFSDRSARLQAHQDSLTSARAEFDALLQKFRTGGR